MYKNVDEKEYKHKKKMDFLEAGFQLFSSRSIEAVTLQEVAKKSGYGPATLYRYFDSKPGLLMEIAKWKWGAFFEENRKRRPTADFDEKTAADMFDFYLDSFLELFRNNRDLLRFNQFLNIYLRSGEVGPHTNMMYQKLLAPVSQFFHTMYEKGKVDHTIRTDISEEELFSITIHLMLAVITRYAVGLVYEPEGFDAEAELELQKEMLFEKYCVPQVSANGNVILRGEKL